MSHFGFDAFVKTARELGLAVELRPPTGSAPDTVPALGKPLDPELASILRDHANGGQIWDVFLYGSNESPNPLLSSNESARLLEDDEPRVAQLIEFAQLGYQATYLATLPDLASADGLQPVIYVDRNEGWIALPIASSVDRAFEQLARYLQKIQREFGSVQDGAAIVTFPWDVPELIADDAALRELLRAGKLGGIVERAVIPEVDGWLARMSGPQ